ncbi:uncharacterized protein LOC141696303 [Apium graveolens]|uniref:uncharacterized protein LOC141696303 n=1 Tax=Apium graveolens TaxID=4045 RepID=UPI003D7A12F2
MCPTVSSQSGITKGWNLILLDDDNTHIHAFAFADTWKLIGKNIVEGAFYIIDTFIVRDASGNLKPVSTDTSIRFTYATTFQPCADYVMIPKYKFEFMDLGDLMDEARKYGPKENPEFVIDIIGVVEDFIKVSKIPTKFGDRDIVRFKICDASNKHRVGIWGDMAKVVSDQYEEYNHEENVIVILTSVKLGTYNDTLQISSLASSKVYFNLDDECVLEMRNRLELEGYKPSKDDADNSYALTLASPYEFINLKTLVDNVAGSVEKKLYCGLTIAKLEEGHLWFSYSFRKCHLEVVEVGNRFKCGKCNRTFPVAKKRFSVKAVVVDQSFSWSILLMDRVVKRLIGCSASHLYLKQTKEEVAAKVFPAFLHVMDRKEIIVVVEVHAAKDVSENFIIKAQDMYDSNMYAMSTSESSNHVDFPTLDLSESFDQAESSKTPGSCKSVSKKIKMEK